nr:odorant receptor 23 [Phthorimaea operculella]
MTPMLVVSREGGDGGSLRGAGSADTLAGRCVAPHLQCLRWCGFCRLAPDTKPMLRDSHYIYCLFAFSACLLYLVQECFYAYQERSDMDKLSRVMFLLLCHVTSAVKQVVFYMDTGRVDSLIREFDDPLFNQSWGARALTATADRARRLQRAYSGAALATCVLWLVFPVAQFLQNQPVEFAFWMPLSTRHPVGFLVVLLYSFYVTTLVGIANTTMDAFIGTVLYQCTTQMRILRTNLENLPDRAMEYSKAYGEDFETGLKSLFRDCLSHYQKICSITSLLQDLFGTAILVQFTIGGWILCMAAYKMISLNVLSIEFASMNLFIMCILTELFVYCYFGNELTYESARLADSLYACGWEGAEVAAGRRRWFARALLLAGERARRPLSVAAGRLVPLSLQTFLKILKSSYTFYAVLRQTK